MSGVFRLHDARLESDIVDRLHERLGRHEVRTVLHVRPLVIVGQFGSHDAIDAHESPAHGQGASASGHALDVQSDRRDGRTLILPGSGHLWHTRAPQPHRHEDEHRNQRY